MKPPSPYQKVLRQLTARALASYNRAIEFELVEGWSTRTQTAWMHYREDLYTLGKMTNAALDDLADTKHIRVAA